MEKEIIEKDSIIGKLMLDKDEFIKSEYQNLIE